MEILHQVWIVAVVTFFFGFCVFIHEFGHLLAALWRKLHVERFSVGFGKAIWKKTIKGVEYRLSWIPFGGYVALPQLEPTDKIETEDGKELPDAKPIDRIITAFAGPLFNILFAFALGTVVFWVGIYEPRRYDTFVIGEIQESYEKDGELLTSPAFDEGLRVGDEVIAVNGTKLTKGFPEAVNLIILAKAGEVTLTIKRGDTTKEIKYNSAAHPDPKFQGVGWPMFRPQIPTLIGKVEKGSAAEEWGLKEGDLLYKINGELVVDDQWVVNTLRDLNPDPKQGGTYVPADFEVKRPPEGAKPPVDYDAIETITRIEGVVPKYVTLTEKDKEYLLKAKKPVTEGRCIFGIGFTVEMQKVHRSPWAQCSRVVVMTYKSIAAMFDRGNKVSINAMSSPVGIFAKMKEMFEYGVMYGLSFVVIISMALAIFNLLPIPILDGGHIVIAFLEMVARRKLPTKIVRPVFYLFFFIIISFALYLVVNDIRLRFKPDYVPPSKDKVEEKAQKTKKTKDDEQAPDEKKEDATAPDAPGAAKPEAPTPDNDK